MPARIITPPMVGVPAFSITWRCDAVVADRLALALLGPHPADEARAHQDDDELGRDHRRAGAEGQVAQQVEARDVDVVRRRRHAGRAGRTSAGLSSGRRATQARPCEAFEPLTITTSPSRTAADDRGRERRRGLGAQPPRRAGGRASHRATSSAGRRRTPGRLRGSCHRLGEVGVAAARPRGPAPACRSAPRSGAARPRAQRAQGRGHGDRVGVVALVDQGEARPPRPRPSAPRPGPRAARRPRAPPGRRQVDVQRLASPGGRTGSSGPSGRRSGAIGKSQAPSVDAAPRPARLCRRALKPVSRASRLVAPRRR